MLGKNKALCAKQLNAWQFCPILSSLLNPFCQMMDVIKKAIHLTRFENSNEINIPILLWLRARLALRQLDVLLVLYIIGHYNPSVRIIDLVSHTTYVVCVNFIHKWRDLQFKVDSERQIFWETFHGNFINSQSFCQKSAERKLPKKYFLFFVLMSGLGLESWLFV